jgi:hypothetical protein
MTQITQMNHKYIVNMPNDGTDWIYHTNLDKLLEIAECKQIGDTHFIIKNGFSISIHQNELTRYYINSRDIKLNNILNK